MPNKRGTGLLAAWVEVPADKEDEFNRWHLLLHDDVTTTTYRRSWQSGPSEILGAT